MPSLVLENEVDSFDLDEVLQRGRGVQALSGVTGLGLPPVQAQWLEGAGDGAIYRGQRVLPRDIDLPLLIEGQDRADLDGLLIRLSMMLSGPCTLKLVEPDGSHWTTEVVRVGGGDYAYGVDTDGTYDCLLVITLRAGDPFFTSSVASVKRIGNPAGRGGLLNGGLAKMQVASSQAIGTVTLENLGSAAAYPLWEIVGPGRTFAAVDRDGRAIRWNGVLAADERLTIDTRAGTVVDHLGRNRYSELSPAPRFWTVPPGLTSADVSLLDTDSRSSITCSWRPRKWMVV